MSVNHLHTGPSESVDGRRVAGNRGCDMALVTRWNQLSTNDKVIAAAIGSILLVIITIILFSATVPEGVESDRWSCQLAGGVPIMNRERDQMVSCAMPAIR